MRRRGILLALLIGCGGGSKDPAAPNDYFPLRAGSTWTYRYDYVSQGGEFHGFATLACRGRAGDAWDLTWIEEPSEIPPLPRKEFRVSTTAGRIEVLQSKDLQLVVVPADFRSRRATSSVKVEREESPLIVESAVEGEEIHRVPAGEYPTVQVHATARARKTTMDGRVWYAKGVGPVHMVVDLKTTTPDSIETYRTEVALTAFKP